MSRVTIIDGILSVRLLRQICQLRVGEFKYWNVYCRDGLLCQLIEHIKVGLDHGHFRFTQMETVAYLNLEDSTIGTLVLDANDLPFHFYQSLQRAKIDHLTVSDRQMNKEKFLCLMRNSETVRGITLVLRDHFQLLEFEKLVRPFQLTHLISLDFRIYPNSLRTPYSNREAIMLNDYSVGPVSGIPTPSILTDIVERINRNRHIILILSLNTTLGGLCPDLIHRLALLLFLEKE